MVTSYARGHKIYFKNGKWFYLDNNEEYKDQRPCAKCGHFPTKEGYDYCLGYIKRGKICLLWTRSRRFLHFV